LTHCFIHFCHFFFLLLFLSHLLCVFCPGRPLSNGRLNGSGFDHGAIGGSVSTPGEEMAAMMMMMGSQGGGLIDVKEIIRKVLQKAASDFHELTEL